MKKILKVFIFTFVIISCSPGGIFLPELDDMKLTKSFSLSMKINDVSFGKNASFNTIDLLWLNDDSLIIIQNLPPDLLKDQIFPIKYTNLMKIADPVYFIISDKIKSPVVIDKQNSDYQRIADKVKLIYGKNYDYKIISNEDKYITIPAVDLRGGILPENVLLDAIKSGGNVTINGRSITEKDLKPRREYTHTETKVQKSIYCDGRELLLSLNYMGSGDTYSIELEVCGDKMNGSFGTLLNTHLFSRDKSINLYPGYIKDYKVKTQYNSLKNYPYGQGYFPPISFKYSDLYEGNKEISTHCFPNISISDNGRYLFINNRLYDLTKADLITDYVIKKPFMAYAISPDWSRIAFIDWPKESFKQSLDLFNYDIKITKFDGQLKLKHNLKKNSLSNTNTNVQNTDKKKTGSPKTVKFDIPVMYSDSLQIKADNGDSQALYSISSCYINGYGTSKDKEKGFIYLEKAATAGNAKAQSALAAYLLLQHNYKADKRIIELLKSSAKTGDPNAYLFLFFLASGEIAVDSDEVKYKSDNKIELLKKSAEYGNLTAQYYLGTYYEKGELVGKNVDKAIFWYKKSIENGGSFSVDKLLILYNELKKESNKNINIGDLLYYSYIYSETTYPGSNMQANVNSTLEQFSKYCSNPSIIDKEKIINDAENWIDNNPKYFNLPALSDKEVNMETKIPHQWVLVEHPSINKFIICNHETTNLEWEIIMNSNMIEIHHSLYPVIVNDYLQIIKYCNMRSIYENLQPCYEYSSFGSNPGEWPDSVDYKLIFVNMKNTGYRLPTESEWEIAAAGSANSKNYKYCGSNNLDDVGWFSSNLIASQVNFASEKNKSSFRLTPRIHRVKLRKPNELGIYDMSGNVKEWCWSNTLTESDHSEFVLKGGDYRSNESDCTIKSREVIGLTKLMNLSENDAKNGFRLVRTIH